MRCYIKFITLGTIILLCLAGCESLVEYDIRGEWDFTAIDELDGTESRTTLAIFTGSKESGTVTFPLLPPDSEKTLNPVAYTVLSNHVIMTRPGLPSADCGDCGFFIAGDFTGADNVLGTWYDYKSPQHHYGTWAMTRR